MSKNWVADIAKMHEKYGVNDAVRKLTDEQKQEFLKFRVRFLEEELTEMKEQLDNPEEVVDALIDLCVVAIGTLDAFDVDAYKAWNAVHKANMAKEVGIKESRPNPLGLPDLIKPEGWQNPSHEGNWGTIVPTEPMTAEAERQSVLTTYWNKLRGV
jgi:hypothetical protein